MWSRLRPRSFDPLFDFRHHAYTELGWYFGMLLVADLALGLLGATFIDYHATDAIPAGNMKQTCQLINQFLVAFTGVCFGDGFINFCLVCALPSVMKGPKWAGCGLASLVLSGVLLLGKVILVILGAVWIVGQDGKQCEPLISKFYSHSYTYFLLVTVLLALQVTMGTLYLLKCGLQDAVEEGVDQLEQEALIRQARSEAKAARRDGDNSRID